MATINPLTGSVVAVTDKIWSLNILLLDDSDAMVSVISKRVTEVTTSCQGNATGRWEDDGDLRLGRVSAQLHNKKKAQMTVRVRRPIAIAHRLVSGC
ncbi:hypothetical protein T05_3037 [Trichinella murrelli]|uniref:Uncharacterized protein n=1 Tax=Trichinella murrelli TaxID=144512 RepID=A0A0V0T4M4_9BILA|nr:hypothetical protein T05_3037 [Trichinella murrelli]